MRYALVAAVTLVIGFIIGGLPLRAQMRSLQDQLSDAQSKECKNEMGTDLARMFQEGSPIAGARAPVVKSREAAAAELELKEDPADDGGDPNDVELSVGSAPDAEASQDPGEQLDLARDALDLRRTQARAALIEHADPDDEQLESIDNAVSDMNNALFDLAEDMVDRVQQGEELQRRDMMEFAADTLDVLLVAEDQMIDSLQPDQRDGLHEAALDPFSYVDPGLIDLFEELDP